MIVQAIVFTGSTEAGATRTAEFLAINPNGRVPVMCTDAGEILAESGAIQWYLADGSPYLPEGRLVRARILQWMFFEQYSHEPNIAVLRHCARGGAHRSNPAWVEEKTRLGHAALEVMETHLRTSAFFAGDSYTIADISLFAYTHVAHEGGFSLQRYGAVCAWLRRVEQQPGHVPMLP